MFVMEPGNMEETSTENAKISDSGYSNTCSNSQSHTSSGSSVSRDSNRSASSGYHGGNPSTFGSCTETLPKPIAKRKDKGYKKKKSKGASVTTTHAEVVQAAVQVSATPAPAATVLVAEPCKPSLDKTAEEVAVIELVDATDPGVHNESNLTTGSEAGLASKAIPIDESSSQSTEEYYAVISMHDGLVLNATASLQASLGYPKDSWAGKLFIDFLDPKDRHILTERIASESAISHDFYLSGSNSRKTNIFCRLRKFSIPPCTNGFIDQYVPFRVNLVVQNFDGDKLNMAQSQIMLLIASFQPVRSAYKVPEETIIPTVFTTRHTATCRLSYVDPDVVQYLGYLPQDMIDRSLFDFYHPEDLPLIKDIYQTIIKMESSSFRSKPYRCIVQNGGCVALETEWSSFINPWTKNIEFIVGQHRVLKGPADPNVFRPCVDRKNGLLAHISGEVLKEAKVIEKEILALLAEAIERKPSCAVIDYDLLSKKNGLISFAENILQEIKSPPPIKDHMAVDDRSFSEHDSVMLGEISPHHEYFDSKSSTETPPSYNQLNYHDNIERFFNSSIGVNVNNGPYVSDEENLHSSANSCDEPGKNNNSRPELKCTSSTNGSGNSGSAENLSSESNNQQCFGSGGETSNATSNNSTGNGRFKPPLLTESLLNRHNEDMEKLMVQKHREQKKGDKRNKSSLNDQKVKGEQPTGRCEAATNKAGLRLKRSGSQSREGDTNFKISKYCDSSKAPQIVGTTPAPVKATFTSTNVQATPNITKTNPNINLWPPISMTVPSSTTISHQCCTTPNACSQTVTRFPVVPQMFPVYYVPMPQPRENPLLTALPQEHPGPPNLMSQSTPYCFVPVPYMTTAMPNMMYPPLIGATTAPAAMMYRSYMVPDTVAPATPMNPMPQLGFPPTTVAPSTTAPSTCDLKRPASRATSDKAEPGSTMAMSESSKKIFSPYGIVSSGVSNEGGCFFSSSVNKSCDSSCNTDQRHTTSSFELYHNNSKESRASQARKACGMVRKEPPWIEGVKLTPELVYQYQISPKSLDNVLKADLDFLKYSRQSNLVNDQLGQLFLDLEIEGFGSKLILDEAGTNSASDSSSDGSQSPSRMGAW